MFLEIVRSEGLSHLSYIVGDAGQAAVIDPRRDCQIYLDIAHRQGARVTHILETHRNEDYVIGSRELADRSGARILHGSGLDFGYGEAARHGQTLEFGDVRLTVLETPGHTDESLSFALSDTAFGEAPVAVFTGDALFIGDVGRTDFYPDRAEEVAGKLYDSIHNTLLPLGDQVLVYPAHGAGSVCGSGMASREFSTLGYERQYNPRLQLSRDEFIRYKVNEHHYQPPYFREMERANQQGPEVLVRRPRPKPYDAGAFAEAMDQGMAVVDLRDPEAVCGAHIPGSLAIPLDMLPAFAGWYLPYDKPIGLVVKDFAEVDTAVRYLLRLNYTDIAAFLDEGLHGWEVSGRAYGTIPAIHARELKDRIESGDSYTLLDVRALDEVRQGRLPGATHVYVGEVGQRLDDIPRDRPITTFCGSGQRALVAASVLLKHGFKDVEVCLGSMAACRAVGCPVED